MRKCWREKDLPADMVKGVLVPLFNNKVSQYCFFCLLTNVYKMFAATILLQVAKKTEFFLRNRKLDLGRIEDVR